MYVKLKWSQLKNVDTVSFFLQIIAKVEKDKNYRLK